MAKGSIRIVTHRKVNLTKQEYEAYQNLCNSNGSIIDRFISKCVQFDDEGSITEFTPAENMPLDLLYFLIVISVNQRLRKIDHLSKHLSSKISELDAKAK